MKQLLFLIVTLNSILHVQSVDAQIRSEDVSERIYVHTDRDNYLVGEIIWFQIYAVIGKSDTPSEMSKIAYLEVLNDDNEAILQQVVKLEKGIGSGSLYIPFSVDTEGYKLRSYTRWMRNNAPEMFFEKFISVVNPFTAIKNSEIVHIPEKEKMLSDTSASKNVAQSSSSDSQENEENSSQENEGYTISGSIVACKDDPIGGKTIFLFKSGEQTILQTTKTNEKGKFSFKTFELIATPNFLINPDKQGECYKIELDSSNLSQESMNTKQVEGKNAVSELSQYDKIDVEISQKNLKLIQEKVQFSSREKVSLSIQNASNSEAPVNLSISVYKIDSLNKFRNSGIVNYFQNLKSSSQITSDNYTPEYEGQMISGSVTTCEGEAAAGEVIYLYNRGENVIIYTARTDENGQFLLITSEFIPEPSLQLVPENPDDCFKVTFDLPYSTEHSSREIPPFLISESDLTEISKRSVYMQINNVSKDEFIQRDTLDYVNFFESGYTEYKLDDYTRFNSLETTFREYIPEVSVSNRRGDLSFKVRNEDYKLNRVDPLVLVDGVVVADHNILSRIHPNKIDKIRIGQGLYLIGEVTFYGVIGIITKPGANVRVQNPNEYRLSRNQGTLAPLFPEYATEEDRKSPKPDLRTLLYWNSSLRLNDTQEIAFYTSDVKGTYRGVIQGINTEGELFSGSFTFSVK